MEGHKWIVNNLKAEINKKGLSIKEVSKKIGISNYSFSSRLSLFSKGKDIRFSFFENLAKALDISIEKFFKK